MEINKIIKAFESNNYKVSFFNDSKDAASYLDTAIDHCSVCFGDSETLLKIGLYDLLCKHNTVHDPMHGDFFEEAYGGISDDIFITSVNGASEEGILINLDGTGNRIAGTLFGHKKVYFVFGTNKIEKNLEDAVWRVRNVAAPLNAKRHGYNTPCAVKGDKCYDCKSEDRICNGLTIYYKKMRNVEMEIILINESLGL